VQSEGFTPQQGESPEKVIATLGFSRACIYNALLDIVQVVGKLLNLASTPAGPRNSTAIRSSGSIKPFAIKIRFN
jgi:hypothetical protein